MSTATAGPSVPLVVRYLQHARVEKRLADRTLTLYALDLEKLKGHAEQAGIELTAVQPHHIRRWVAQMHSGGRSARGIALILSGWRNLYVWLGREGLVAANPVADVRAPKAAKPLPKALGVDEAVQLASFQSDAVGPHAADPWLEARDAALVELLYGCGLRVGELVGLDVAASALASFENVKRRMEVRGTVALVGGNVTLQRWLAVRSGGLPAQAADQTALFTGQNGTRLTAAAIWHRLRQRSLRAGLSTPVHPHMLRHSYASHLLQSSGDLRAVQELLGHANISTTQVYTRLDFQHLAKAYDAAHPRAKRKIQDR